MDASEKLYRALVDDFGMVIVNIRPAVWYSEHADFKPFESLEDFLAAMEEVIYQYPDTRVTIALHWKDNLIKSYEKHYGRRLDIPRWNDIAGKYLDGQNRREEQQTK